MSEVVILGLGYIGLPTAALIASNEIKVHGVDCNTEIVDIVNSGRIHIVEPDLENYVSKTVENGFLKAYQNPVEGNTYIVVVPTPFTPNKEPELKHVEDAIKSISALLKVGDLVIIESTCPVGTTEKMGNLIFSLRPELESKIYLAYCPERVLPGNVMYELANNDRVVGGLNTDSTQVAVKFYSKFVKGELHETDAKTAEMCKLVENASRDNQIAFANELSVICEKADIDVWNLIDLANKHPRVNILQPGCGVGGHCIAVDPYFIVSSYEDEARLIKLSREVNNTKPFWVIGEIKKAVESFKDSQKRMPLIALMGLAFKPNIDDLRESPAKFIVDSLLKSELSDYLIISEPNLNKYPNIKLVNHNEAVAKADIIAFLVAHDDFKELKVSSDKCSLNFCGI